MHGSNGTSYGKQMSTTWVSIPPFKITALIWDH